MMTKNILTNEDMEAMYLFPEGSQTNKEFDKIARDIFSNMVHGLGINPDEFQFMVFDDGLNAFFISNDKTQNGKNLISVSLGLLNKLSSRDELAAIMAHECGHYIWKNLLGGTNTIFQERIADLYSIDLLINGGYNPVAMSDVLKKLSGNYHYSSVTLDVHGNQAMRIDDVNAYLTKISNEKGEFPELKYSPEYFEEIKKITRLDEMTSDFFEREIFKKFKRRSIESVLYLDGVSRLGILQFMKEQLEVGNVNSLGRARSFLKKFPTYLFKDPFTREELDLCQDIFTKYAGYDFLSNELRVELFFVFNEEGFFSKELFGPFKEQAENLQKFIDSAYDEKAAEKYAKLCVDQGWIERVAGRFSGQWPRFKAEGENNIGKKLPWVKMQEYSGSFTQKLLRVLSNAHPYSYYYSVPEYSQEEYLIENDIVVAYGENIQEIIYDREFEGFKESILPRIQHLDMMLRVKKGEISIADYYEIIENSISLNRLVHFIISADYFKNLELVNKSKKIKKFLEDFYAGDFYKNIVSTNAIAKDIKPRNLDKDNAGYAEKLCIFTSGQYINEIRFLAADVLNKLAEYISENKKGKNGFVLDVSDIYADIHNAILKKDYTTYSYYTKFLRSYGLGFASDRLKDEEKKFKTMKEKVWYPIALDASNNKIVVNGKFIFLNDAIEKELSEYKPSIILQNILKNLEIKEPTTHEELLDFINNSDYEFNIKLYEIYNYILKGYKFNAFEILESYPKSVKPAFMSDIFSQYLRDNYDFSKDNLIRQINLYTRLLENDLFSEKLANKNEYAKIITKNLLVEHDFNSPDYKINIHLIHKILMREMLVVNNFDFEFVNEREKLIDFYADYWARVLGRDDGSQEYVEKIQPVIDLIKSKVVEKEHVSDNNIYKYKENTVVFSPIVAESFVKKFTNKIVAQKRVADLLEKAKIVPVSGKTAKKYDYAARGAEALISIMARSPERVEAIIKFLSSRFTEASYLKFITSIDIGGIAEEFNDIQGLKNKSISKETFMVLHENFWAADLQIRAVITNRLLNAGYHSTDDKINLILDTFFDKNSEYRYEAELIVSAVYNNLKEYERNLIISAIICAGQRDENNNITAGQAIGHGLKLFLANKGPAFIKFGQLLSYMPNLDSDIRKELATMRDKADIPSRYELFQMIENTLPQQVRDDIEDVGEILGAGSFYVTVRIKYKGENCVVSLMRPNVAELTESGMKMINKTIDEIVLKEPKYKPLTKVVKQARVSAESEIDIDSDYKKYLAAVELYENLRVSTPTGDYQPDVAKWMAHGKNSDGTAYKIMEMAPGNSLTSDEWTEEEKHDFAVAYVTLELCILLSGQQWDTDRHQGQQNFYNHAFRDFAIGIFDTAAQMDEKPNITDKVMLGMMLFDMLDYEKSGKDLSDVLMKGTSEKFAKRYGASPTYIDGVKRGLTALSDIIEYQKEVKDENGNVIQESKRLTRDDMQNIISAVVKSGVVSKTVLSTIGARAIVNGMITDMAKYVFKRGKKKNPISVEYKKKEHDKKSKRIDKSKEELDKLIEERNKEKKFGINKDYIYKDDKLG